MPYEPRETDSSLDSSGLKGEGLKLDRRSERRLRTPLGSPGVAHARTLGPRRI